MDLKLNLAVLTAKLISRLNLLTGSGATSAPGLYALKIDPGLISKLSGKFSKNILLSGTNGKTTTTRMISQILDTANIKHIHNRAGSNLLRGIASTLIKNNNPLTKIGLWEVDEAVFPLACEQIKPDVIILTNLFRDQLDRYGDLDYVANKWQQALKNLPSESIKILNADDPALVFLGKNLKNVFYFGLDPKTTATTIQSNSMDSIFCFNCGSKLAYKKFFVGHLGIFSCPKCSLNPPSKFTLKSKFKLPGLYNLYNYTTAALTAKKLNIAQDKIDQALTNFKPAFGRIETINTPNKTIRLFLVKNPTGFNQVISTVISELKMKNITCLIAINDLIADGCDVSWLWDVDFEKLVKNIKYCLSSGIRAHDLSLRLKYADFKNFATDENLNQAIDKLLNSEAKEVFIFPTYTCMLEIRKILASKKLVHKTWND